MRHARTIGLGLRLSGFVADLLDLVHPRACVGCSAPGRHLCPPCLATAFGPAFEHAPRPAPAGLPVTFAATAYDGVARQAILAWKERSCRSLAAPLGAALAEAVTASVASCSHSEVPGAAPVTLVPIPASRASLRLRGEDVLDRLTRRAQGELRARGTPAHVEALLDLVRAPEDQAGLGARQRRRNLEGALRARPPRQQAGLVVIIDDIVTTGSTLAEAARALRASGHHDILAAVIAATPRTRA